MGLRALVTDLESLPEEIRAFYREEGGKFVLDVDPADGYALEDVSGLKSALAKERTNVDKLKKAGESWGDLKPEDVRSSLAELERLREAGPDAKAKLEEQMKAHAAKVEAKFAAQLQDATERAERATERLGREIVDRQLAEAIAEHQGLDHFLRPALRDEVRIEEEDGEYHVRVLQRGGDVRLAFPKGEHPRPMTVSERVAELKADEKWANAFQGATVGGSGGSGSSGSGRGLAGAAAAKHLASLPPAERLAQARKLREQQGH